jgi:hypothetical protein
MTSGVFRPYSLVDVLGSINNQNSSSPDTSISGVGALGEADEQTTWADSASTFLNTVAPTWDREVWGAVAWS